MAQVTQENTGTGVILLPSPAPNPDRVRSRGWCFTYNNYDDTIYTQCLAYAKSAQKYIIGKEVGDEKKTAHLQGFLHFKNATTFAVVKAGLGTGAHVEKAKGNWKQNLAYCSKGGDFVSNMEAAAPTISFRDMLVNEVAAEYKEVKWKDWQMRVLELKNDRRSIHWVWDREGNKGKTFLAKYLAMRNSTVICSGKKEDIFNQVNSMIEQKIKPELVIADIARHDFAYISYQALEMIKNGLLYSGKYEGGKCIFPPPMVIVFANNEPDPNALSGDRWNIIGIE